MTDNGAVGRGAWEPDADDEQEDRAIARALDLDDDFNPSNRDDDVVSEYRVVASHLPFDEVEPPPDLEARVVRAALERRPAAAASIDRARDARPSAGDEGARRRGQYRLVALGAAVAAAAVVIGLVAVNGGGDSDGLSGNVETVAASKSDIATLKAADGTRAAELRAVPDNRAAGTALLGVDGSGVVTELSLPTAPSSERYWLWVTSSGGSDAVRVGDLGAAPDETVGFALDGDIEAVSGVLVTREPTGTSPAAPTATAAAGPFTD